MREGGMVGWLFTEEELLCTPSILDGLTPAEESRRRSSGCRFISDLGSMLRLPAEATCAARVYFHRFFMRVSFGKKREIHPYMVGGTALFVACKTTDNYRKLSDVVTFCRHIASQQKTWKNYSDTDKEAQQWRDGILYFEELMVSTLCFDFLVDLPHPTVACLLEQYTEKSLQPASSEVEALSSIVFRKIRQHSTKLLDDCMSTTLPLRFTAQQLALIVLRTAIIVVAMSFVDAQKKSPDVRKFLNCPLSTPTGHSIFDINVFEPHMPAVILEQDLSRMALELLHAL